MIIEVLSLAGGPRIWGRATELFVACSVGAVKCVCGGGGGGGGGSGVEVGLDGERERQTGLKLDIVFRRSHWEGEVGCCSAETVVEEGGVLWGGLGFERFNGVITDADSTATAATATLNARCSMLDARWAMTRAT
jgi:hypothetical protein